MQIQVKIRGLMVDPSNGTPIVILKDLNSDVMLPIWVGAYEANAIALEIEKTAPQRPMTHDLLRNMIIGAGAYLQRVVINDLHDSTFFAVVEMVNADGETVIIDSRPSDAIALALRCDCPILVEEEVLRASRTIATEKEGDDDQYKSVNDASDGEEWPDVIGDSSDLSN